MLNARRLRIGCDSWAQSRATSPVSAVRIGSIRRGKVPMQRMGWTFLQQNTRVRGRAYYSAVTLTPCMIRMDRSVNCAPLAVDEPPGQVRRT